VTDMNWIGLTEISLTYFNFGTDQSGFHESTEYLSWKTINYLRKAFYQNLLPYRIFHLSELLVIWYPSIWNSLESGRSFKQKLQFL
jgi:hypothetical protein